MFSDGFFGIPPSPPLFLGVLLSAFCFLKDTVQTLQLMRLILVDKALPFSKPYFQFHFSLLSPFCQTKPPILLVSFSPQRDLYYLFSIILA